MAGKVAESLPPPPAGRPTVLVLPFQRDLGGEATEAVRHAIERVDCYSLPSPTIWENVLRQAGLGSQPVSPEEAEKAAFDKLSADYLLAGRVESLSARSDKDEAVLEVAFVPVGAPCAAGGTAESSAEGPSAAAAPAASGSRAMRFRARWCMIACRC